MSRADYIAQLMERTRSPERLRQRLESPRRVTAGGCWEGAGTATRLGYARLGIGIDGAKYVHRVSYEVYIGPVPDGLEVDHLCRNRACYNPAHLEPVSRLENMRRSSQPNMVTNQTGICQRGHNMADDWVWTNRKLGTRACRQCRNQTSNDRRARQRESDRASRGQGGRTRSASS